MSDLKADGLHINISDEEALDWLKEFLETDKFSSKGAEGRRKFALILIDGLIAAQKPENQSVLVKMPVDEGENE